MFVCFKHRPPLIHGNMQSNQHGGVLPPPPKTMRAHQPARHTSSFEGQTAQQPQQLIIQVLMFFLPEIIFKNSMVSILLIRAFSSVHFYRQTTRYRPSQSVYHCINGSGVGMSLPYSDALSIHTMLN